MRVKSVLVLFLFVFACDPAGLEHWEKGQEAYSSQDWPVVIQELERYVSLTDNPDFEAYFQLGNAYYLTGDYDKAFSAFSKYPLEGPNAHFVNYNLACLVVLQKDAGKYWIDSAEKYFQLAVDLGYRDFQHIKGDPDIQELLELNFAQEPLELYFTEDEELFPFNYDLDIRNLPFELYRVQKDLDDDGELEWVIVTGQRKETDYYDYYPNGKVLVYGQSEGSWRRLAIVDRYHLYGIDPDKENGFYKHHDSTEYLKGSLGFYDLDNDGRREIVSSGSDFPPDSFIGVTGHVQVISFDQDRSIYSDKAYVPDVIYRDDDSPIFFGTNYGDWGAPSSVAITSVKYEDKRLKRVPLPLGAFKIEEQSHIKRYEKTNLRELREAGNSYDLLSVFYIYILYQPAVITKTWVQEYLIDTIVPLNPSLTPEIQEQIEKVLWDEYRVFLGSKYYPGNT